MSKITIKKIQSWKNVKPFSAITAYDFSSAKIIDECGLPVVLVGDSAAMVAYGYDTTIPITMEEMLLITKAVSRGVQSALVVGDMPFLSYQSSISMAVKNAGRFLKEGGVSAVKLEGGGVVSKHINKIVAFGIPVMGHVGLLPQSYHLSSGYRIQGKTKLEAEKIFEDAISVQKSGAFSVVLEGIPTDLAIKITNTLDIPTIGIGAGFNCDGQIQVYHDILGLYGDIIPRHTKRYANFGTEIQQKLAKYKSEVEAKIFPTQQHSVTSSRQTVKTN